MSHFDALYEAHGDDISMIAIHFAFITKDQVALLSDKDCGMPFANDSDNSVIGLVGGNGTPPQTVVQNRKGEVIYNKVASVTAALLEALYEGAER